MARPDLDALTIDELQLLHWGLTAAIRMLEAGPGADGVAAIRIEGGHVTVTVSAPPADAQAGGAA